MSGRRSKKNQKFGSSRRGNRGLRVNDEKDNEFDGPDEVQTTNPFDDTVLEAQFDHLPNLKTDNPTTAFECSPRAESPIHKASDVEADLPETKRKIGSTRKKAGGFENRRNLEPCEEVRTSEEFGEEQENQLSTSTTEEEHTYQTKNEQRNASSDLWQQTQKSGSRGELGVAQNIMVTVSQSKETDAIHHQEISSYSQTSSLEAGSNMAMEQSAAQSNVVTMAKTDHETLLVSTEQKRKMGSTRRPLGGNREQNRENVEVEELFRNTTDDVWKAEVKSNEAEFSMLNEMMQTWDDVKRISPTTTSPHTESAFVSSQPLSSERTEELDVPVETETNNKLVACSVIDLTKPPSDRFGNHEKLFLNKELVCFKLGLETDNHAEDFNVFQNVSDSPPTRSENFLEVGGFSDTYQDVPNSRHNTSEDCGSVTLVETKEEPCRSDPNIIISSSKQDTEIDKLVVNVEEPLSSPCPLDVATKYGYSEIPTDVLTVEVGRISETLESHIIHAEPTKIESTPKMTDPGPDRHGLEDEEKETLMEAITSGQEMKMEELYTQSTRLKHKEENMNIQSTDDLVEQEIQLDMQQGETRKGLQKHSANETNVSESSLCSANCNLANVSPVTERLHNVNMNLSSLLPEDSKLSCDVMVETVVSSGLNYFIINNQVSHAIVPETENQDIYDEIKEENDIDVIERSITCDVTVTEIVMDVENFTKQSVDPQTLATWENENVGTKTGPETDALEIKDQDNVENNAKDGMIMQIIKNDRENKEDEGDTKYREKQPGSQIQGRPFRVDPDKESYDFFQDTSVENAEESLLNANSESAFDGEGKTCEKSGGHEKMDASAVTILDVTEPLANIPDNDIRSDLQTEKHSSHINFEALTQDTVTENSPDSSAVSEQTEISIIPEDSQGVQKKDGDGEGVAEKDKGLEFQDQNNVMDQNIKQTMMVVKGDESEMTEKVRWSTQELCDDEADKAEGHAEITLEQQQRSSLNISQIQDGPPRDDSENLLESEAEEVFALFLRANTVHAAFERMIKTNDESKEIEKDFKETEAAEHLTDVNIQDHDGKLDLETENAKQNVFVVTDSSLSFEDSEESHKKLENISEIPEDSQKEEKQSKIKPLVHKQKMGSTRSPLKGSKGQQKDKEQDDDSETLNNLEKELEKEISGGKDTGPVEELDSTIIQSSCNAEKSTEESICDITESQTTTKCHAESQENAGDVESLPTGGDTEAHLEIQTDINMFDSTIIEEVTEENICDDDVLMRHVELIGDTFTLDTNMTIESDFLQNNTSLDTNHEALKSFENAQNVSTVTDTALPLKDVVLVGSGEKTEMSIISDNSQGDSPSTLNPLVHKRKMGSTRRPLKGNKEKRKNAEEKEDGGSEGVAEEDTDLLSETQEQNNVIDDNIIQTIDVSNNEEHEMTETVRKSAQELCDDAVDKAEGHAEITSEQQLRSLSNICQTQDGSPQDESENMLESEMDFQEEKETENDDEKIFAFEDISSEVTVTPQAKKQIFIQTTDADSHDYIQTVKDEHEESQGKKMFLSANANLTIQDNDSQSDLQTENSKQNKVLTDDQNTNATPHINLKENKETEPNVFIVTDSSLSFKDSEESHIKLENISEIPEDSQKEEKQSKIKPLVHKRKMGSTRSPLKGSKGQRKDKEQDDDSEKLNNEEKEMEKEISGGKDTGPVEKLDSTIIQSSCSSEKSTEESICDITESQTTTKCHAESQENAGDVESLPTGGDTEAHLEIQTDINMFDSTIIEEVTEENICDDDVLMRQVVFVEDAVIVETNMTIESDLLQNNTSLDTHQEALKSSENVSAVTDFGLLQQDVVLVGSGETKAVSEKTEISDTSESSQRDSSSTLNLLAHKRKMGSTRRPLRGNKGPRKDREQEDENETLNSESLITGEKSTDESICDITESQTTTKCYADLQDTAGDVASLPTGGDTEAHLEIQTDINMFDSTMNRKGPEENICDDDVLMRQVVVVEDAVTVETNMTIESDFLQNNTSLHTNHEALKSFENVENTSTVIHFGLVLQDVATEGSLESNTVPEKTEISIIPEDSHGEDSHSKLNPFVHKRKMGSTRRPLRGNKDKEDLREAKEEDMEPHSEIQEQNDVTDHETMQKIMDVRHNKEKTSILRLPVQELCEHLSENKVWHSDITLEQEQTSLSNISQTQTAPSKDDSCENLPEIQESNTLVLSEALLMEENQIHVSNSNTNPLQNQDKSEILISEKSQTENIQSNINPNAQKRKMGLTSNTLRGNGRRTQEVESKEIDGDSERTSEEQSKKFSTVERAPETKLEENTQLKETRSAESLTHTVATSKIFFETEGGVKKVSTNIVGLSVVSEEIRSNEAPSEAFCTDLQSEMLVGADEMKVGEKSGLENLDKSESLKEVASEPQLQLTVLDQLHQMHSEKHPQSEKVTPERRRKLGSTRKNLRGKQEEKKREESESNQFAPEEDQDGETSIIPEAEPDQIIHKGFEESDSSLLSEIERALRKTSPSSQNNQLIVNEPNLAKTPETSHFNTPENSKPEQGSDKEKYVSLQVTESQNQSDMGSPRRRRKMGSTRKNPRQQLQTKREDENEEDETEEKNKQESKSPKKDLEAAEESKMHDLRDNAENKEYLDVPVTLTNTCQTEESTISAGQEGTSPSTKRKFGSRRTNIGKRDLGGLIPPESNDDLTEDTGARLVSLDQMIKASQHDGQTAGLKNISDMKVVQFNVVMVGNSSVGKTSFIRRFHGGEFSSDYSSTIGVDTCVQNIMFHDRVVKLQIWDTAGQESITTQVFHRADGLFLMYEVTSSKSFISVRDWISQIQEKAPEDVIVMLLGNKNDCAGREVQVQEGEDLAREYKIHFMECSAATGDNVSECMKSLAEMLMQRKRQKIEEHTALKRVQPQKKSGCC